MQKVTDKNQNDINVWFLLDNDMSSYYRKTRLGKTIKKVE